MIRLILISFFFCLNSLYAMDCQKRLFNININEKVSIQESLDELAKYCSFSIIIKDKIAKEKLHKQLKDLKALQENNKIKIDSQALNIAYLQKSFYQNPSYKKALNLANKYFEIQAYKKSIFWALKANELDRQKQDSWLIFAKAKRALGQEREAKRALQAYMNYYGFIELDGK